MPFNLRPLLTGIWVVLLTVIGVAAAFVLLFDQKPWPDVLRRHGLHALGAFLSGA